MPSRTITSALCLAAAATMGCLDTGTAFVLPGTSKNNNNWRRKDDADPKTPLDQIGVGGGFMLPHLGFAAGSTMRIPRVPSAVEHLEQSRASSCLLRLQDVFGEHKEGGNCALEEEEEEEEEGKNGAREQEGGEGDEAEKEVVVLAEEEENDEERDK
eukprot:jgi/Undpi1/1823/HiC_scaffold_12.g05210.m1